MRLVAFFSLLWILASYPKTSFSAPIPAPVDEKIFNRYVPKTEEGRAGFAELRRSISPEKRRVRAVVARLLLVAENETPKICPLDDRDSARALAPIVVELWAAKFAVDLTPEKAEVASKQIRRYLTGFKGERVKMRYARDIVEYERNGSDTLQQVQYLETQLKIKKTEMGDPVFKMFSGESPFKHP